MLRIAIFEDRTELREGFVDYINSVDDFEITGAFPDCENLERKIRTSNPDVVLMDINMPGMDGIEAVGILKVVRPDLPVIMLTVFEDTDKIFAAICAGACGYLLKITPPDKIIEALTDAHNGGSPMSPYIARKVLTMVQKENQSAQPELIQLTAREKDVLACLVKGMSYKMIADHLGLAFETIRTNMKNIYTKLHVSSASQAVSKAIHQKLV